MKRVDLTETASRKIAKFMLYGLMDISSSDYTTRSSLESLGVIAVSVLMRVEQLDLPKLLDLAVAEAKESNVDISEASLRESLQALFGGEDIERMGITFHEVQ